MSKATASFHQLTQPTFYFDPLISDLFQFEEVNMAEIKSIAVRAAIAGAV